jgi:hypothetical protein
VRRLSPFERRTSRPLDAALAPHGEMLVDGGPTRCILGEQKRQNANPGSAGTPRGETVWGTVSGVREEKGNGRNGT